MLHVIKAFGCRCSARVLLGSAHGIFPSTRYYVDSRNPLLNRVLGNAKRISCSWELTDRWGYTVYWYSRPLAPIVPCHPLTLPPSPYRAYPFTLTPPHYDLEPMPRPGAYLQQVLSACTSDPVCMQIPSCYKAENFYKKSFISFLWYEFCIFVILNQNVLW